MHQDERAGVAIFTPRHFIGGAAEYSYTTVKEPSCFILYILPTLTATAGVQEGTGRLY